MAAIPRRSCWLLALLLLLSCALAAADELVTCGGFVKADGALAGGDNVDFGQVSVELRAASSGAVTFTAEVDASGYYYAPVYDARVAYELHVVGPVGWTFEPASHPVGDCDVDHDFTFTGFTLRGRVAAAGRLGAADGGPAGVTVELWAAGKRVASQLSGEGGAFAFEKVTPGEYELRPKRGGWSFAEPRLAVSVPPKQQQLPLLVVKGYMLSGAVVHAEGGAGVAGATVTLSSGPATATDEQGRFEFRDVDLAAALSVAVEHPALSFAAARWRSTAGAHGDVQLDEPVRATAFSVAGKAPKGMAGATVGVDAAAATATVGADGRFSLSGLPATAAAGRRFTVSVTREQRTYAGGAVTWSSHRPADNAVPASAFALTGVDVCGSVEEGASCKAVTASAPASSFKAAAAVAKKRWCVRGAPVDATLRLVCGAVSRDVAVGREPIKGVALRAVLLTVSGTAGVPGVTVTLRGGGGAEASAVSDGSAGSFTLSPRLAPDTYQVSAEHSRFCFASPAADPVRVEDSDVSDVRVVPAGVWLSVDVDRAGTLRLASPKTDKTKHTFALDGPGRHRVCVPQPLQKKAKRYAVSLVPLKGAGAHCAFETTDADWSTDDDDTASISIGLRTTLVELSIRAPAGATQVGVQVEGQPGEEAQVLPVPRSGPVKVLVPAMATATAISITPQAKDGGVVFTPPSHTVRVAVADGGCPAPVDGDAVFGGAAPRFVTGRIKGAYKAGDEVRLSIEGCCETVDVDARGAYRLGPLPDGVEAATAVVEARSESLQLRRDANSRDFTAVRLGSIRVALNGLSAAAATSPVLLTLSSKALKRPRHVTVPAGESGLTVGQLTAGEYVVRALLKEHELSPAKLTVTVGGEDAATATFTAKRVAFSVVGAVRSLAGLPVSGASLSLVAAAGSPVDEAVSDDDGAFTLRGMKPGDAYTVQCPGCVPVSTEVRAGRKDSSVSLTALHTGGEVHLTGTLQTSAGSATDAPADPFSFSEEQLTALGDDVRVHLAEASAPATVLRSFAVADGWNFFEFHGLPVGRYVLTVTSAALERSRLHRVRTKAVTLELVPADSRGGRHVSLPFVVEALDDAVHRDLNEQSLSGLVLGVAAMAAWLNRVQIAEFIKTRTAKK